MLFNSIPFAVFFIVVSLLYFAVPSGLRRAVLLGASYYFYWSLTPAYTLILFAVTAITYACALAMHRAGSQRKKKYALLLGAGSSLSLLVFFKYTNFLSETLNQVLGAFSIPLSLPLMSIILPVGISFYVFRVISYMADVYSGKMPPERHFGLYALYVSFFPSLLAGPIDRAVNLLPQMRARQNFDADRIWAGTQLFFWGLFKKVVIADRLAMYVDTVYGNLPYHSGLTYIIATYFYTVQIYCDFSGYTDMAIGCGRIFGFELMKNFNLPLLAVSMPDFYRRWHISLSTWFRDYVYIPLGGSRKGSLRTYVNLMLTMLLVGLWHGAGWTYVLWGGTLGIYLSLSRVTIGFRDALYKLIKLPPVCVKVIRTAITFHLLCFSLIIFRANNLADALHIIKNLFTNWPNIFFDPFSLPQGLLGIIILFIVHLLQLKGPIHPKLSQLPLPARWIVYWLVFFGIVLFGVDGGSQFIYFQF